MLTEKLPSLDKSGGNSVRAFSILMIDMGRRAPATVGSAIPAQVVLKSLKSKLKNPGGGSW